MKPGLSPKIIVSATVIAIGVGFLLSHRTRTGANVATEASSTKDGSASLSTSVQASAAASVTSGSNPSAQAKPAGGSASGGSAKGAPPEFEYASELTSFANLRAKVFLSSEEKSERKRLVNNPTLLRSLGPLLKYPAAVGTEVGQMQNQAIDLLLEAKAQGDLAAGEVMRSVIEDRQIENEKADPQERRLLAGIKAEVLFQWSAQEPQKASDMERWLPGPVSQRIWQNVRAAQQQNLSESAMSAQQAAAH